LYDYDASNETHSFLPNNDCFLLLRDEKKGTISLQYLKHPNPSYFAEPSKDNHKLLMVVKDKSNPPKYRIIDSSQKKTDESAVNQLWFVIKSLSLEGKKIVRVKNYNRD